MCSLLSPAGAACPPAWRGANWWAWPAAFPLPRMWPLETCLQDGKRTLSSSATLMPQAQSIFQNVPWVFLPSGSFMSPISRRRKTKSRVLAFLQSCLPSFANRSTDVYAGLLSNSQVDSGHIGLLLVAPSTCHHKSKIELRQIRLSPQRGALSWWCPTSSQAAGTSLLAPTPIPSEYENAF